MTSVVNEHFVPNLGLELEPYLDLAKRTGLHHLARYQWSRLVLEELRPSRIIDLGCGAGYGGYMIAKAFPNSSVLGIDFDGEGVRAAAEQYVLPNLRFARGDARTWEFGDHDVVVCFDVIEHIEHREVMMQNVVEHLSPEGAMLLSTPVRSRNVLNPGWEHHKIEYSPRSLIDFLRRYFSVVQRSEHGSLPCADFWEQINSGEVRYNLKANPVVCLQPIAFAATNE